MQYIDIGPIHARVWDPKPTWGSAAGKRPRPFTLSGLMRWSEAEPLGELVDNDADSVTHGGATGVLEYVTFVDDVLLSPFSGWYLLADFNLQGSHEWSLNGRGGPVSFSLDGAYLGEAP